MRSGCCGQQDVNVAAAERSWTRALGRMVSWIMPGAVLVAMPKCPLCLAAYVALFTGLGISLAAARFAWWSMGIGCVVVLLYLTTTAVWGLFRAQ